MEFFINIYRKLFARKLFFRFNYLIFRFGLSGMGILNYKNNHVSGEFYLINNILPTVIKGKHPLLLDVGANVGNYTTLLSDAFPHAQIHSFEPHPNNYDRLKSNIVSKNVTLHNIGLGDKSAKLILYDRETNDGSEHATVYKDVISDIHKQTVTQFEINIETLDGLSEKEKWNFIDYLKIDTEGHELSVLKGASHLLQNGKIGLIHFEFNEMNVVSRVFFRDFKMLLSNYDLYRLLPHEILKLKDSILLTEIFAFQNIIAIPRSSLY